MSLSTQFIAELVNIHKTSHEDVILTFQKHGTEELYTVTTELSSAWTVHSLYVVQEHYAHRITYGGSLYGNWKKVN